MHALDCIGVRPHGPHSGGTFVSTPAGQYHRAVSEEAARVELIDGLQEAKLIGEIDLDVYEKVCAELAPLFEASGDVTLDLSEVAFLDSSAIRLFVLESCRRGELV